MRRARARAYDFSLGVPGHEEPVQKRRVCDFPGCEEDGEHRAPKSPNTLNDYFYFCREHAAAYNKSWNFFAGRTTDAPEEEMRKRATWDRPTWPMGDRNYDPAERLRRRVFTDFSDRGQTYGKYSTQGDDDGDDEGRQERLNGTSRATAEVEALAVLDLKLPVTMVEIRQRYHKLAKRFHPDANPDNPDAEERLKTINQAYQILKRAYGQTASSSSARSPA